MVFFGTSRGTYKDSARQLDRMLVVYGKVFFLNMFFLVVVFFCVLLFLFVLFCVFFLVSKVFS